MKVVLGAQAFLLGSGVLELEVKMPSWPVVCPGPMAASRGIGVS